MRQPSQAVSTTCRNSPNGAFLLRKVFQQITSIDQWGTNPIRNSMTMHSPDAAARRGLWSPSSGFEAGGCPFLWAAAFVLCSFHTKEGLGQLHNMYLGRMLDEVVFAKTHSTAPPAGPTKRTMCVSLCPCPSSSSELPWVSRVQWDQTYNSWSVYMVVP